jgi:hypothetical protein
MSRNIVFVLMYHHHKLSDLNLSDAGNLQHSILNHNAMPMFCNGDVPED